jgi:putative iron-dependent peroxidase
MPTPQPGVLPAGGAHAYFLTFTVAEGAERTALNKAIRNILPSARALARKAKRARLLCTLGIGSELWDRLSLARRPAGLRPFHAVKANGRVAPATGGDLFLQITSGRHDLNLDLAMGLVRRLQPLATMAEEVHGFRYRDSQDLT